MTASQPNIYCRVMVQAMKKREPFSVMTILREVNQDGHPMLSVQQCLRELKRMKKHGLVSRGALGMFEWKE